MRIYALIAFLFLFTSVLSQESQTELNGRNLYTSIHSLSGNHYLASESAQQKILQLSPLFNDFKIDRILKHNDQLYFPENGSGRILILDSIGGITRLDHTQYGGDRFGAFTFFHNDTLYSIGGYGFWHVTGAIRFFDPYTKDWTPIIINRNIALANNINAIFFYSKTNAKLYTIHGPYIDEYVTKESSTAHSQDLLLDIFDLNTKKWQSQPLLINPKLAVNFSDLSLIASTGQHLILNAKRFTYPLALDLIKNQVLEIDPSFVTTLVQLKDQHPLRIISQTDSSIILSDLASDERLALNAKTLIKKKLFELYTPKAVETKQIPLIWFSACLNVGLVLLLIVVARKKSKKEHTGWQDEETDDLQPLHRNKGFVDLLNDTEQQILLAITEDFKAGRLTSIDKINKILGIEKRPYKIKNNLRADALKMINKKFMDYLGNDDELIIRERSAFDKRFFEYTINERYVNKISFKKEQVQD